MTIVDYARSYLFFTTKGRTNTARLMVEARCELVGADGVAEEFFFFASCKSEETYAERRLFKDPNYDFCGIFSARDFKIFRASASYERDQNSAGPIESTFESVRLAIQRDESARVLDGPEAIIRATLDGRPLVGRTAIEDEARKLHVFLEYPIKTINVHAERGLFQVDTGPIPYPDDRSNTPLGAKTAPRGGPYPMTAPRDARAIERMQLAFVAYNRFDRAELILQQPTPVLRDGREVCRVLHYSNIRELPARNTILMTGEG